MGFLEQSSGTLALRRAMRENQQTSAQFNRIINVVDGLVRVVPVISQYEMDLFIKLPYKIYEEDTNWPGQIDEDVIELFEQYNSPMFNYISIQPFLAVRDGEIVGRISACTNEKYSLSWGEKVGFFGFFECINDQEVANMLFLSAEKWLREKGKTLMSGPVSPTFLEIVGILVDGHDKLPVKYLSYNPSYYIELITNYGMQKQLDMHEMMIDVETLSQNIQNKLHKIYPFIEDDFITARYFDRDNYERDSEIVKKLFEDSFQNHIGFYKLSDEEWTNLLEFYLDNVHEELFVIIEDAGEPIAFAICFMDKNQLVHSQLHHYEGKVTRQRVDLIGVKPNYLRGGIGTYLVYNLIAGLQAHDTEELSISWILEDNYNSLGLCKSLGMYVNTTFRVYEKEIG